MSEGGPSKVKKGSAPKNDKDAKDAGKDIPKDDKAKEEAKKAEEMKEMNEFIDTYGGPILRDTLWEFTKMDHPDTSVLRFLRARKWDIDRALAMLAAACKFRLEKDVSGIIYKGEEGLKDVPGFMNQMRRGISYIMGSTDKMENPIYFIHVARHFTSAQKHEVLQDYVLLAMENARTITTAPYEKAVVIFDMAGFGLKNMDWQCVLFLVKCLEAYYPNLFNVSTFTVLLGFSKGIWQVLQPMLDPVVRDKIKFSSKAKDLEELVPASKIRKGMGGTMDWDWDYIEVQAGENDIMKDTKSKQKVEKEMKELTDEFEKVTQEWFETTQNDDENEDLAYRREVLAKQIRVKNYQLQPFHRAKTIYQRAGIITYDGTITWKYPQTNGKTITQVVNDRHNYGSLIKWLKEHNEDTLEDSFGHQKLYEICDDGTIKKSYGGGKGGKSSDAASTKSGAASTKKSSSKKGAEAGAAAGGAAAGAAAGVGAALKRSKSKSKKKQPEPEPESESEDGFEEAEDAESEPEPEPAPRAKRSPSTNKSLAQKPSQKAVEPEPSRITSKRNSRRATLVPLSALSLVLLPVLPVPLRVVLATSLEAVRTTPQLPTAMSLLVVLRTTATKSLRTTRKTKRTTMSLAPASDSRLARLVTTTPTRMTTLTRRAPMMTRCRLTPTSRLPRRLRCDPTTCSRRSAPRTAASTTTTAARTLPLCARPWLSSSTLACVRPRTCACPAPALASTRPRAWLSSTRSSRS